MENNLSNENFLSALFNGDIGQAINALPIEPGNSTPTVRKKPLTDSFEELFDQNNQFSKNSSSRKPAKNQKRTAPVPWRDFKNDLN